MSITQPTRAEIALALFGSTLARRFIYRKFIEEIGLNGDELVLDFGSGWGDSTRYLSDSLKKGGLVTALDVSSEWQAVIKKRMRGRTNIRYIHSDVRDSGLPDSFFDVIVISYVLHDIPKGERRPIVNELVKKLRPGGIIHLREPTKARHGMAVNEIRSLMAMNGLVESRKVEKKGSFKADYSKAR